MWLADSGNLIGQDRERKRERERGDLSVELGFCF